MQTDESTDPREHDPVRAQRIDPKTGRSDDPRVDPEADGRHDEPSPAEREPNTHDLKLDP